MAKGRHRKLNNIIWRMSGMFIKSLKWNLPTKSTDHVQTRIKEHTSSSKNEESIDAFNTFFQNM